MSSPPNQSQAPAAAVPAASATAAANPLPVPQLTSEAAQELEVDNSSESESGYGSELSSYSTSLSSSVQNYKYEYGRRYHSYAEGSYKFPNDEAEQDRLDMFHFVFTKACGGNLHFAPIKKDGKILDIGTGTGIWAIEMAETYPDAQVVGNDLSPIQPNWVPPNVKFLVDDVESEWVEGENFDFIHSRYMCASIKDWPRLIRQIYEHTTPGGWAEFKDYDGDTRSDDGTVTKDYGPKKMIDLLGEAMNTVGRILDPGPKLKGWMEEAGFINVEERTALIPIGTWPKDKRQKEIGAFFTLQYTEGIDAFTNVAFTQILGWKKEEVEVFNAKVREDVKNRNFHAYNTFYIVYGQKPPAK